MRSTRSSGPVHALHGLGAVLAFALLLFAAPASAQDAQTIVHLLDYVGIDYAGAVDNGQVKSADEFAEMLEFTGQVIEGLKALPDAPARARLIVDATHLRELVQQHAAAPAVAEAAGALRWAVVGAYNVAVVPRTPPRVADGRTLFAQQCAACHGAEGRGDGPAAKGLDPAPSNFHDDERMSQRSVYGLYNTISLGVHGTAMQAYRQLADADRWALAFYVSGLRLDAARVANGERLFAGTGRRDFPDLANVATLSEREVEQRHGRDAVDVQQYLRAHPEAVVAGAPAPIDIARSRLGEAKASYARGDRSAAREAAIRGYLDGFELVESGLANIDGALMRDIERRMLDLRAAIERGVPAADVARAVDEVDARLAQASERLSSGGLTASTAFTSSLLILLREGLEAILVLAAIVAFVVRTGRRDALPWVHGGWVLALALGAVTWVVATYVIGITGANRELTEGVTALIAAVLLLYVGYWLHGKSYADAWSRFIRERVGRALEARTLTAIAAVSFLAVYREMFEVVLFYQALWIQAGDALHHAVLGGVLAGALALAVIGFAIFRWSVRLPLGPFFAVTSMLLALMAVVFAGHGVAALQEAGVLHISSLGFQAVPLLGIYPSVEALSAQAIALALVAAGWLASRRTATRAAA